MSTKPTLITIFADASFCPKSKAAGWGAWAMRDGWQRGRFMGGVVRTSVRNSTEAELCGLAAAMLHLDTERMLSDVEAFILQCDNTAALGAIAQLPTAKWSHSSSERDSREVQRRIVCAPVERQAIDEIRMVTLARPIWLRHVKGHAHGQPNTSGRHWVNQQCDNQARRHMLERRRELAGAAA